MSRFTWVGGGGLGSLCFCLTVAAIASSSTLLVAAQNTLYPSVIDINNGNVSVNLMRQDPHTKAFLLREAPTYLAPSGDGYNHTTFPREVYNCSTAPNYANSRHLRSSTVTVKHPHVATFDLRQLSPGTYKVCVQNVTGDIFRSYGPTITVIKSKQCAGGKFGICKIDPAVVPNSLINQTFTVYHARPGTKAFLVLKNDGLIRYNCSAPPPMWTMKRSAPETISASGHVTFTIKNLVPGSYSMCFYNHSSIYASTETNPPESGYVQLSVSVVISGDINPTKSSLTCCDGPFNVGEKTFCTITAVDTSNNPAGSVHDACKFRVCPLTDGKGMNVDDYVLPYFVRTGVYEFWFRGKASGCAASAGASYKGRLVGNKVNYFSLKAGPAVPNQATSSCSYNVHTDHSTCNVTQRDTFGNPVRECSIGTDKKLFCSNLV